MGANYETYVTRIRPLRTDLHEKFETRTQYRADKSTFQTNVPGMEEVNKASGEEFPPTFTELHTRWKYP